MSQLDLDLKRLQTQRSAQVIQKAADEETARERLKTDRVGKKLGYTNLEIGRIRHDATLSNRAGSLLDDQPVPDPQAATLARIQQTSIRDYCVAIDQAHELFE